MALTQGSDIPFEARLVGGIPFRVAALDTTAGWLVDEAAKRHVSINVRLANAYNVALADSDPDYFDLMARQGVNFPDGTPVVWFMNRGVVAEYRASRVRGPSLFEETMRRSVGKNVRHFLLGSTEETLSLLKKRLADRFPGVAIAGSYSPPFAPVDTKYIADCARAVEAVSPDLVWVGLGTPKQDVLGTALAHATSLTTINVGAAFDFSAGTVREAPHWIQNSGMEWCYRLVSEPRRLWKRYFFGNIRFLHAASRKQRRATGTTTL